MVITAIILENSEYLFVICGNIMLHQQRNTLLKALPTRKIFPVSSIFLFMAV